MLAITGKQTGSGHARGAVLDGRFSANPQRVSSAAIGLLAKAPRRPGESVTDALVAETKDRPRAYTRRVCLCMVLVSRSIERLQRAVEGLPGSPLTFAADALDRGSVESVAKEIGAFDHLAVTAVADETKLFAKIRELDDEKAVRGMEKFWISLNAVRAASRYIRPTGSITLTSSTAVTNPPREGGASVMNAASGAVAVLGRSLAAELAPVRERRRTGRGQQRRLGRHAEEGPPGVGSNATRRTRRRTR